jgi:hypothetical protein
LRCLSCKYDLRNLSEHRCPECGREFDPNDVRTFKTASRSNRRFWIGLLLISVAVYFALFGQKFVQLHSLPPPTVINTPSAQGVRHASAEGVPLYAVNFSPGKVTVTKVSTAKIARYAAQGAARGWPYAMLPTTLAYLFVCAWRVRNNPCPSVIPLSFRRLDV